MKAGSSLRLAAGCFIAATLVAALPILVWWYITSDREKGPAVVELEIVPGTAELVAGGGEPPTLPKGIILAASTRVIVRNEDSEPHRIGRLVVPAGTSGEASASEVIGPVGASSLLCTFHPAGAISLDVAEGSSPVTALLLSGVVGLVLGGASFGVIQITSRLES